MTNGEKFKETFGFGADGSRVIAVNATWWDCEFLNRKPKPITNADRIRAMTEEELAGWIVTAPLSHDDICPSPLPERCGGSNGYDAEACKKCWLDWLRKEGE